MTKAVSFCDKAMFAALLLLVIFVPYSAVMIEVGLMIMMICWIVKRSLIWKANPHQSFLNSYSLPVNTLQWSLIVIGILILVTIPFSHDPALSLKKFFSRFLQQICLMYLVLEIVTTSKRFWQLMAVLLWTFAVVNADIFVQYFCGHSFIFSSGLLYGRVSGPMRHPNDLGTLLATVIPVVLSLLIIHKSWTSLILGQKFSTALKVVCAVLLVLLVISLGLTSSRGAWLAFVLSMMGYAVCIGKRWIMGAISIMLVVFFVIFGMHFMNVRSDIFTKEVLSANEEARVSKNSFSQEVQSTEKTFLNPSRRSEYWQVALKVINKNPLFGCGYNAYIQTLKLLHFLPEEYPHSSLMQITAELGIVGLLAHLWFFLSLGLYGIKTLKSFVHQHREFYVLALGICFGLLAWLIHSFTDTPWESLQLNILWWLLIGVLLSLGKIAQQSNLNQRGA
ncbi:MAG: O-antigen ligase family protein [Candidatus Omnitrophica bacterium]|nr:O-antigen ligase family protein [Candidatus Omnitrophota bacterium]